MHNVGAVFRTSDGAGVEKLYLTGYTACPPRKEISKTALDADQFVAWEYHSDPLELLKKIKEEGVRIIALEKNDTSHALHSYVLNEPACLILGNEIEGVKDELLALCDDVLHIPMHGQKISLNVSVAFGIAAYQLLETT